MLVIIIHIMQNANLSFTVLDPMVCDGENFATGPREWSTKVVRRPGVHVLSFPENT